MLPGMDMKKLKKMMKGMETIEADRVIIEGQKKIVIENPQVVKINLMGQETYQIVGEAHEVEEEPFTEEDVEKYKEFFPLFLLCSRLFSRYFLLFPMYTQQYQPF